MNYLGFYHNGRRCTCHTCKHFACTTTEYPCKDCIPGLAKGRFFDRKAIGYEEDPELSAETMAVHELKILPKYFVREKNFELRKNDRNFQVGDIVVLREWSQDVGYSGDYTIHVIRYILTDAKEYGLEDGYCILGLSENGPW
jgi:hypothetical protein